jgi:hypothetical protein
MDMSAKKFREDLTQGNIGEKIVATWLEKYKDMKLIKFNNTMAYDFIMEMPTGKNISYEIKTDRWETFNKETGNIFIETRCNGKASGVWGTCADVYCFYFPDYGELYFIKTDDLRNVIATRPDILTRTTLSGDGGKVSGFLINRYKNKNIFKFYEINKLKVWSKVEKNEF